MPEVFLIYGPPLSGKTTRLMEIMKQKHETDPLSYIFLGPSGYYVREFADRFIRQVGSIVRKNFYAVDQFAVEIYKEFEPQLLHINEEFEKVILLRVLENMDLDSSIKRSSSFVDDLLEVIRDIKERGDEYLSKIPEEGVYLTVIDAYNKLKNTMYEMKLFDSFDAYIYLSNTDLPLGFKGKYLFIDGFYDFTPVMAKMLKNIFKTFEEIYITCTIDNRTIFSQTKTILKIVSELGSDFSVIKERVNRRKNNNEECNDRKRLDFFNKIFTSPPDNIETDFVELERYPNKHVEVENLCKKVKKMLATEKYEPGDIAFVLGDFQGYKTLFLRKLESYGIPYRLEGDFKLSEAFVVNLLLLPLEVISKGYPPELIMSMVDFGYFSGVNPVDFESIFLRARVINLPRKRFRAKDRKNEIMERLSQYQEKIEKILESAKHNEDFAETEVEYWKDEYERVKKVKSGVMKIFEDFLEPLSSRRIDVEKYKALFVKWIEELKLEEKLKETSQIDQLIALKNFLTAIDELRNILKSIKKQSLGLPEYKKYLSMMISSIAYKPSLDFDNRVELLSLEASRFKTKKLKIYVGFNEGIYPRVRNNPFYSGDNFSEVIGTRYYLLKEQQQKLDLFVSMSKTTEKVLFTYPAATIEGEPLLLSSFYYDIFHRKDTDVEDIIKEAEIIEEPNSLTEFKTQYILSNYPENRIDEIEENVNFKGLIDDFDKRLREDVHEIKDTLLLKELVGNRFSYTKVATFKECGIKFFYRYILKIPEEPERHFEFTPREKGLIYHAVFSRLFKGLVEKEQDLITVYNDPDFKEELNKILRDEIEKYIYYNAEIVKDIEIEYFKEHIEKTLEKMIKEDIYHISKDEVEEHDFTPRYFEIPFGFSDDDKVILEDKGLKIELTGRIDRLDVSRDSKLFLIDYKTTKRDGKNQLAFYTLSIRKLDRFKNFGIYGGCIIAIENNSISHKFKLDEFGTLKFGKRGSIDLQQFEEDLMEKVKQIYYNGYFSKNDKTNCYRCPFKNLCANFEVV